MPDQATVEELFALAIVAERAAERLYRGLASKFAHHQEIADFWEDYAAAEAMHARWLEQIRDELSTERRSKPADVSQLGNVRKALEFSVENALEGIEDLEEAYQLANELEHAETNVVFEFLIENFSADHKVQAFLRSQLRDHVAKIMIDLPPQFSIAAIRRTIKAAE